MIEIILGNRLYVKGLPYRVEEALREGCIFNLNAFSNEENLGELNLFERESDYIVIPRGYLYKLQNHCNENKLLFNIKLDVTNSHPLDLKINPKINYTSGIFGYQGKAVHELMRHNTGRMWAPTASGKTNMACLTAALLNKGPILFLADKDRLLKQFTLTVEKVLGIPEEEVGLIKAKKFIIKPITAGSLRTLGKDNFDLEKLKKVFSVVFFDECHISTALTYRRVLLGLAPEHLYGLSATPHHYMSEDLSSLMDSLLGPVVVKIDEKDIPKRLIPSTATRETGLTFSYKAGDKSPEWLKRKCRHKLHKDIMENSTRNDLIVKDTIKLIKKGFKILITVARTEHGRLLHEMLEENNIACSFPYKLNSKGAFLVDHKQLDKDVHAIEKGIIDVQVGTLKLFQTGYDCPSLSAVFIAGPMSGLNTTALKQLVGRIQRHSFGKTQAILIDYTDDSAPNNILRKWSDDRSLFMHQEFKKHEKV